MCNTMGTLFIKTTLLSEKIKQPFYKRSPLLYHCSQLHMAFKTLQCQHQSHCVPLSLPVSFNSLTYPTFNKFVV